MRMHFLFGTVERALGIVAIGVLMNQQALYAQEQGEVPPRLEEGWRIERREWSATVEPGMPVAIHNELGDIRARISSDQQVWVSAIFQIPGNSLGGPSLEHTEANGKLRLDARFTSDSADQGQTAAQIPVGRADLSVLIPKGSRVEFRTRKGLIEAKDLESDVDGMSVSGAIRVRTSGSVQARTKHGAINVTLGPDSWEPDLPQVLETETGDITLWLPFKSNLNVRAETEGLVTSDYSTEIGFAPPPNRKKEAGAKIGDGGPLVSLRSIRGDIRILRLGK